MPEARYPQGGRKSAISGAGQSSQTTLFRNFHGDPGFGPEGGSFECEQSLPAALDLGKLFLVSEEDSVAVLGARAPANFV